MEKANFSTLQALLTGESICFTTLSAEFGSELTLRNTVGMARAVPAFAIVARRIATMRSEYLIADAAFSGNKKLFFRDFSYARLFGGRKENLSGHGSPRR